jgi:monofunctional biosynthetic peptidoglycan transglycosylase
MTVFAARTEAGGGPRSRLRRYLALAVAVIAVIALVPVALVPVYRFLAPVSVLMIYHRLSGPVEQKWVPLQDIAPSLVAAAVMSEDAGFCGNDGVDWRALAAVIDRRAGPDRGASTITMQVVKNLFLWNSRSYVRKAIEIPLALYANLVWPKRRTIEIYLNIAQLGPAIFGVEAAAEHYFKRSARELSPLQAALLVAALPNPIERDPARPSRWLNARAHRVAAQASAAGRHVACIARPAPAGSRPRGFMPGS